MLQLEGYRIYEELSKNRNSTIYRGVRESDGVAVIVKYLNREYPSSEELADFIREYELMKKLACNGMAKAYAMEKCQNSLAIIMEDIGGDSVSRILKKAKLDLREKLSLAILMTRALAQLHQKNIVHKDINPTNFIWNVETNRLVIIDFGISSEIMREPTQSSNRDLLEGTLDYISPEQTGKTNRPIDYRTDLYSIGITFYEIFTGRLPFMGEDDLDIVYSHIAKPPLPPSEISGDIPEMLSAIIMKLISKAPEERYQSAAGLLKDLEYCLQLLDSGMKTDASFRPGRGEVLSRFEIPSRLYGRTEETEALLDSFQRVMQGGSELFLVAGHSGTGKSTLINEIRKPVAARKGYFVSGKFNQYERNIPYYGFSRAFRNLVKQLLSESQKSLDEWRRLILEAVGSAGQIMLDMIPELERIMGQQPQLAELGPIEAQNRFQLVFLSFLRVFARAEHPLVIFLDDLQWSDTPTLELIKFILTKGNVSYLFFIGAYRDNEVQEGHPLLRLLEELGKEQSGVFPLFRQVVIEPLDFQASNRLIADTLHMPQESVEPLTRIIHQKTKGNPLFLTRLLNSLYKQGSFTFVPEKGQWTYDLKKVEAAEISDNVIDLLVKELQSLPAEDMDILKLAACIGNRFDISTVSRISGKPVSELGKILWTAIEKELVFPMDNNYRFMQALGPETAESGLEMYFCFAHDRIRQAVYSLIPEDSIKELRLLIGTDYLKAFRKSKREDSLFDMVNHLNKAGELISARADRLELAELNIMAGNRAKKTTAFSAALAYYEAAEALLRPEEWAELPDKHFRLLMEQAGAALLTGGLGKAEELCGRLSEKAESKLDKGEVSNLKILLYIFQGKLQDTIGEARSALGLFGVFLPESEEDVRLKTEEGLARMRESLAGAELDKLTELPRMQDPEKLMAMQILASVIPPAIQVRPEIFTLASLMMLELTLTYGTSPLSCKNFGDCGVIFGSVLSDYKTGYNLGRAAYNLAIKLKAEAQLSPVFFISTFLSPWRKHYSESIRFYDLSYQTGMESGDLVHVTYAAAHKAHMYVWVGKNLDECLKETRKTTEFLKQAKAAAPLLLAEIVMYCVMKFQAQPGREADAELEERCRELQKAIEEAQNTAFMGRFLQYNAYVSMIMGDFGEAERWSGMADEIIAASLSDFSTPDHYLFKGMLLAGKYKGAREDEKEKIRGALYVIREKLKHWADNCPENFAHKYYLLSAEIAAAENASLDETMGSFEKALGSIGKGDFVQFRALCSERCALFWLGRGNETIGRAYIREAYYYYGQWGAFRKTALLKREYSHYFAPHEEGSAEGTVRGTRMPSVDRPNSSIDMLSVFRFTQAISREIKIEKLLGILIKTMIANAGAQRGCLLIRNDDGQFYIEASQNSDAEQPRVMLSIPFSEGNELCREMAQYVMRTGDTLVIGDASEDMNWGSNEYVESNGIRSVLCMPVFYQNRLKGLVYLENNLSDNVFTSERLETLKILSSQAAISIENARLYENMEEKVRERTLQLNEANEKLRELSLRDPLTGLYNRRYVYDFAFEKARQAIEAVPREKRGSPDETVIGVLMVDIDHFKQVNDTYGHSAGDSVLITLSQILREMAGPEDLLSRWGGEEFLIILFGIKRGFVKGFALSLLNRIREKPMELYDGNTIRITCSVGCAEMPLDPASPDALSLENMINISDYALYRAKENGRDCAARFKLEKSIGSDENMRRCLVNIAQTTELDGKCFSVEFL